MSEVDEPRQTVSMEPEVTKFLALPPIKWQEYMDSLPAMKRYDLGQALCSWSAHLATAYGYVQAREHGKAHAPAIKQMNLKRARVRKSLGYTYHRDDMIF